MNAFNTNLWFLERALPEEGGVVVGYGRLIDRYNLTVPFPEKLSFISKRHRRYQTNEWTILTPRHEPADSLSGDLTFALRYEGVHFGVLNALFAIINPEIIARWIRSEPTGRYSRRIWFLYEWLTGNVLDVPDVTMGNYIEALNPNLQITTKIPIPSRRHRVKNNVPDTLDFCPLILQTELPSSIRSLEHSDRLKAALKMHLDIPDQELEKLIRFLVQSFKRSDESDDKRLKTG